MLNYTETTTNQNVQNAAQLVENQSIGLNGHIQRKKAEN